MFNIYNKNNKNYSEYKKIYLSYFVGWVPGQYTNDAQTYTIKQESSKNYFDPKKYIDDSNNKTND